MKRIHGSSLSLAAALLAAVVTGGIALKSAVPSRAADEAGSLRIGAAVAPFSLPDAAGKSVPVGKWQDSKATVIIFVATRCPVSNAYNGRMAALAADYGPKGVTFYGVNANRSESPEEIARHAAANGLKFPILKDAGAAVADRFGAQVTPEAYVVGQKGTLVYWGQIDNDQNESRATTHGLRDALDAVLAGKSVAVPENRAFGCSIKR